MERRFLRAAATLPAMAYSQQTTDHFENPRNVGSLDGGSPCVGTALVGSPGVGEVIRLQIRIDPATGLIGEARFKAYGSGAAIAAASLATEWLCGRAPDTALAIAGTDIVRELGLPPERVHCAILVAEAIEAAVSDYRAKHGQTIS